MSTIKKNIASAAASFEKSDVFYLKIWDTSLDVVKTAISAEERMHAASLDAQSSLLASALKGAETVDPDNFGALIVALKEVSLAGIEAQRAVHLESVASGRAAIKAMEGVAEAAITAFAPVAMTRAQAQATRAEAEVMNAETRSEEAEIKKHTAETERTKAETARETARQARYSNGKAAAAV
jgi:hypothetical protein